MMRDVAGIEEKKKKRKRGREEIETRLNGFTG